MDPLQDLFPGQLGDSLLGPGQGDLRVKSRGPEGHEGEQEEMQPHAQSVICIESANVVGGGKVSEGKRKVQAWEATSYIRVNLRNAICARIAR
jgi:hypothetical protein